MRSIRLLLAGIFVLVAATAQPAGTASITGKVILRTGGETVRKAAVTLIWHGSPMSMAQTRTDSDGRFVFEGLPAGRYTLHATRNGLGTGVFGEPADGAPAESVTLRDGERREGLVIRLSLPASIGGVVYDADDEPAQGASVQIMMEAYPRGTRQLVPTSEATTNLRGEYQVNGLRPGKYYVVLRHAGQFAGPQAEGENEAFRPQFYGGATDWKRAAPINVASGQQVRGIDFRAVTTHAVQVTGHVSGAPEWHPPDLSRKPGDPEPGVATNPSAPPFVTIQLQPIGEDTPSPGNGAGAGPPDYKFEMNGVIPGRYKLTAILRQSDGPAPAQALYARQFVDISEQPSDIEVTLAPAVDLKGTLRYEGDPAVRPKEFRVELVSGDQNPVPQPTAAKVNPDGTFTFTGVPPGIWDINAGPIPKGGFLKSMRLGKQDVLTEEMEIGPGKNVPLNIVISSRGGKVKGEIESGPAAKPAMIMLAPVGDFAAVMSFFAFATTDGEGKFELSGLTPGKYRLFAFERAPQGDFRGPDIVEKISALGESVEVVEGEVQQVRAKPITPEQLRGVLE